MVRVRSINLVKGPKTIFGIIENMVHILLIIPAHFCLARSLLPEPHCETCARQDVDFFREITCQCLARYLAHNECQLIITSFGPVTLPLI